MWFTLDLKCLMKMWQEEETAGVVGGGETVTGGRGLDGDRTNSISTVGLVCEGVVFEYRNLSNLFLAN